MQLADIVLRQGLESPNRIMWYDEFALLFGDF